MTKQEIITKFELYYDDGTALSSQEESDLFDKIYQKVCSDRPWEFLRSTFTGNMSTSVPYVSLPSDFAYLMPNNNYTGDEYYGQRPVVFVGSAYAPWEVISAGDRRQYRNQNNYAYIDIVNNRLVFPNQPITTDAIEFDYAKVPATLALGDTPLIPTRFQDIIYHGMIVDQNMIEMTDKSKSYAAENQAMYNKYLVDMAYWNAQLIQM